MAVLIPALGSCVSRMTSGERRLAERLEQKLEDDYLLWYDVPMGPRNTHPDFCVMHPRRGILVNRNRLSEHISKQCEVKSTSPLLIHQANTNNVRKALW